MRFLPQKSENEVVVGVAFVAFAQLIVKASGWDQMRREVLKDPVYGVFMNNLVKNLEECPVSASQDLLKALFIVLRGNLKSRIPVDRLLRILLTTMDRCQHVTGQLSVKIYQDALRCVPLVIDSGSTWAALLEHIAVAIHHILGSLYAGFDDEISIIRHLLPKLAPAEGDAKKPFIIEVWALEDGSTKCNVPEALHRITVLSHLLQYLMAAPINYTVDVPVFDLLTVVRHLILLDGTRSSTSLQGMSTADLFLAVPLLHQCAYLVLETMIRQFKSRLFPFVVTLADLVSFEINSTRNTVAAPALCSPDVQASLHNLVASFFEVFQGGVVGLSNNALQVCLEDLQLDSSSSSGGAYAAPNAANAAISAATPTIDVKGVKQNPNKKKAAAKALSDPRAHINAEALNAAAGPEAATSSKPDHLRLAAINCLQVAFSQLGALLDDDLRANVDKTVIGLCITLSRHRNMPLWRRAQFEPAFANPDIRIGIYRILLASAISTGRLQTPVLPFAAQYLNFGLSDPDTRVSSLCAEALNIVNTVIHPRVPLLPPSIVDEQRSSQLSVNSILAQQSEKLLLQQHEERTLMLLQRTQARRSREGESSDMDDERPTKKIATSEIDGSSRSDKSHVPSFLDTMSQVNSEAAQRGETIATTASALANQNEHTVLFKSAKNGSKSKGTASNGAAEPSSSITGMDVDVDIVDDGPDSEDEDM